MTESVKVGESCACYAYIRTVIKGFNRMLAGTIGSRRTERVNIDLADNHVEGGP